MNKNAKIMVLIAAVAIGAIVLVVSMMGGNDSTTPTQPGPGSTTPSGSTENAADKYKAELESLEAQVKGNPTDAKYYDAYIRIGEIYFDIGFENRFTGNLDDCKTPFEKAIKNFESAIRVKDTAAAHAGIGSAIYNIQAVGSYYVPIDAKQIKIADEEFQKALKLDPKDLKALFWYTKFNLKYAKKGANGQFEGDAKLAKKYYDVLKKIKVDDPSLVEQIKGLGTAIESGNTTSHSATSGGTTGGGTSGGATGGTTQGGSTGGQLPAGHPDLGNK